MSHARTTTGPPAAASAASIPEAGCDRPSSSLITRQSRSGSSESFFATTIGSKPAAATDSSGYAMSGRPASSSVAFGLPMRELLPPASTAPTSASLRSPAEVREDMASVWQRSSIRMERELLDIEVARQAVLDRVRPLPGEDVALDDALGRVL